MHMIERHFLIQTDSQRNRIQSRYDFTSSLLDSGVQKAKTDSTRSFSAVFNDELSLIGRASLLNLPKSVIHQHLFYAHQFGINNLKLASSPGLEVELTIGNTTKTATGRVISDHTDPIACITLFCLSIILRDQKALTFLKSIPDNFLRKTIASPFAIEFAFLNILSALSDRKKLKKAILEYDETDYDERFDLAHTQQNLYGSVVNVLKPVLDNNQSEFDNRLAQAIHDLKKYFTRDNGPSSDPFSWISYYLLAAAAYAFDQGMNVTLETDYLPLWMVKGEFSDCELTVK